ncbi:hypothetical protein LNAT_P1048 [Lebetimonas natsushimae]|uniref:Uncharacterized protein n=1 Tax=Lebetimonas natsushimae TaxID=1936991 RepID=A0A292YET4_9BACT|nr:hypothetical protein LNAT_P1048 [Lebetimonas natsushimae]
MSKIKFRAIPTKKAKALSNNTAKKIFIKLISNVILGVSGKSKMLSHRAKAAFALIGIVGYEKKGINDKNEAILINKSRKVTVFTGVK